MKILFMVDKETNQSIITHSIPLESSSVSQTKRRESNLELYRIIVMLSIVAHHYVVNSGLIELLNEETTLTKNSIFFYLFGMWGKTGINCFVMITGYFMCKSNITLLKFLKLVLEVLFYKIVIYSIFVICGYVTFNLSDFFKQLFFIRNVKIGFVSCFILFYLCIPFLNQLINHLKQRQHKNLIFLSLFIYSFFGTVPGFHVSMNYVSWFCVLYFIASYNRIYSYPHKGETKFWLTYSVLFILLACCSVIGIIFFKLPFTAYKFVSDSNAALAVVVAFCTFNLFNSIHLPYNKWINRIGGSTFGVLLIHANCDIMRQWLWRDTIQCVEHFNVPFYALYAIICVFAIFSICIIIDRIRIHTIERLTFILIDKYLPQWTIKL